MAALYHFGIICAFQGPLALGDVQTNGRRVVVLEVVQVGVTSSRNLKADALASGAVKGGNVVAVAGRDSHDAVVSLLGGLVVVGGATGSGVLELGKVELAVALEGEARGLEVLLLGEEEDEAALLAGVAAGNVKVENGRDVAVDVAKVRGALGGVRVGLVDGDDQVRELVRAVEVGRAGVLGRRGRRGRAVLVAAVRHERHLAAVDALVGLVVDVVLAVLAGGALVKGGLAVEADGAVAADFEAALGGLPFVALQDTSGGYKGNAC